MPQKDQDAQQQLAEIVAVGNLHAEEIAQQHRDKDVCRHEPDKGGSDPFDAVDHAIHDVFVGQAVSQRDGLSFPGKMLD